MALGVPLGLRQVKGFSDYYRQALVQLCMLNAHRLLHTGLGNKPLSISLFLWGKAFCVPNNPHTIELLEHNLLVSWDQLTGFIWLGSS